MCKQARRKVSRARQQPPELKSWLAELGGPWGAGNGSAALFRKGLTQKWGGVSLGEAPTEPGRRSGGKPIPAPWASSRPACPAQPERGRRSRGAEARLSGTGPGRRIRPEGCRDGLAWGAARPMWPPSGSFSRAGPEGASPSAFR